MKMKLANNNRDLSAALQTVQSASQEKKKLQMNFDAELHKQFKTACAIQGTDMTTVVEQLVRNWLNQQG